MLTPSMALYLAWHRERTPQNKAQCELNAPPQACGLRLRSPARSQQRLLACGAIADNRYSIKPIRAPRIDRSKKRRTLRKRLFLTLYPSTGNTRVAKKLVDFAWGLLPCKNTFRIRIFAFSGLHLMEKLLHELPAQHSQHLECRKNRMMTFLVSRSVAQTFSWYSNRVARTCSGNMCVCNALATSLNDGP